jgi:uncharacterized protein (TIGR03000 family)
MRRLILGSALLALLSATRAEAQLFNNPARTYGVSSSTGPGPRFSGLGVGVFPLNYRGAPGDAAGTFTAPNHRMFNSAPAFGMGLGWFGKRSPSPRPEPNFNFNPPVTTTPEEPPLFGTPENKPTPAAEPTGSPKQTMTVEVRVPAENAMLFVNDTLTKQSGLVRTFESPELTAGSKYQYEIRAEWNANGKKQIARQTVMGKAGDKLVADLAK